MRRELIRHCIFCRFRADLCLCGMVRPHALLTQLTVLMHIKEWRRSSNTGVLAKLALPSSVLRLHGTPKPDAAMAGLTAGVATSLMLFPGPGAQLLTPESAAALPRPIRLIVPDGTWGQARQMQRRIPELHGVPTVALAAPQLSVARPRKQSSPDRMSTFEAIAQALGILEFAQGNAQAQEIEDSLLELFQRAAERHLHMRGKICAHELTGRLEIDRAP